jgi:hypothetical protein
LAETYEDLWRALRLWVPQCPAFLAQHLIRDRYRRVCDRRPWSALRAEGEIITNTAYTTGVVSVVRGSTTVTGVGTAWTVAELGRQFMTGGRAPVYTITAVDPLLQTLTLDRAFGPASSAGVAYSILDAYVTVPEDFRYFLVVYDPERGWRLRHWLTQDDVGKFDAARSTTGTPKALVDRSFSAAGRVQYELWPYTLLPQNYPYYYIKAAADLGPEDTLFTPLTGDVLVKGARADLCSWPGTPQEPNPLFGRMEIARALEAEIEDRLTDLERQDESLYMTWLSQASWGSWPWAPVDAAYLQCHA